MSVVGAIAGGIASGAASSFLSDALKEDPEVHREYRYSKDQRELLEMLAEKMQRGPDVREYPGQLPGTTEETPLESLSLEGIESMLGGEGLLAQQQEMLKQRMDPEARSKELDKYFQEAVAEPMQEEFREEVMPDISRRYAPSGFWSGERVESEREAREDLLSSLTRSRAEMGYQERRDALEAAGMVPEAARTMTDIGLEGGRYQRALQEAPLEAEYQEWIRQRDEEDEWFQQAAGLLNLSPYEYWGEPGGETALGGMFGGMGSVLGGRSAGAAGDYLFSSGMGASAGGSASAGAGGAASGSVSF